MDNETRKQFAAELAANPPVPPKETVAEMLAHTTLEGRQLWTDLLFLFTQSLSLTRTAGREAVVESMERLIDQGYLCIDVRAGNVAVLKIWDPETSLYREADTVEMVVTDQKGEQ